MASYSSSDLPKPKMGPVKRSPFQQAFREARAAGKKDFTFNGKKYSTELAKPKAESVPKPAEGSGRGASAGRTAADRDMGPGRPGPKTPAGPRRDTAAEAKGAETLERMKSRAERGMAVRSNEEMRDEAKGRTLGALGAAATLAGGPMLGRGLMSAMERRAAAEGAKRTAQEAARKEPALSGELPKVGGVFRSARQPPPPKPRIKVEGSTSGKYQSARDVEARRAGRKSQEDYARDVMERGAEMGMRKGGMAKAYAKGGSVKGGGCETRSKKTRFI